MADEKVLDHDADGIKELDNPLPAWWLYLFYVSIIFSFYYYVASMFIGTTAADRAQAAMAKLQGQEQTVEMMLASGNAEFSKDEMVLASGKEIYTTRCASCHAADGGGLVGPNMTDNYWIHGRGEFADMYRVVVEGVPEKGMISWKPILSDDEIRAVVSYLKTFEGTTPANPKAPEGNLVE